MNFLDFSRFFRNSFSFLRILILLKMTKKGVNFPQEPWADVARRGTYADATWHARPRGSATKTHPSACVALMWCRHHASPRGCLGGAYVARGIVFGLAGDGPTGIVGPGYSIEAVTHLRYIAPRFILANSIYFLCVGLWSLLIYYLQDTRQNNARRMKSPGLRSSNQVNSGPPDHHQQHVR